MAKLIYDYKKFKNQSISIEQLDKIANIVLDVGQGYAASIIAGVKLLIILAWLIARKVLIDEEMLIAKQKYEQETGNDNQDDVEV